MKGTWLRELYTWQEGMGVQKSIKFADVIYGRPLIYARTLLAGCTILPLESWDSGLLPARGDDATSEVEQRGFRPLPLPRSVLLLWKEEGGNDTRDKGPFGRREREREDSSVRSARPPQSCSLGCLWISPAVTTNDDDDGLALILVQPTIALILYRVGMQNVSQEME